MNDNRVRELLEELSPEEQYRFVSLWYTGGSVPEIMQTEEGEDLAEYCETRIAVLEIINERNLTPYQK